MQTYRKVRKFEQTNSSLYIIATTQSAYDSINSSVNSKQDFIVNILSRKFQPCRQRQKDHKSILKVQFFHINQDFNNCFEKK